MSNAPSRAKELARKGIPADIQRMIDDGRREKEERAEAARNKPPATPFIFVRVSPSTKLALRPLARQRKLAPSICREAERLAALPDLRDVFRLLAREVMDPVPEYTAQVTYVSTVPSDRLLALAEDAALPPHVFARAAAVSLAEELRKDSIEYARPA